MAAKSTLSDLRNGIERIYGNIMCEADNGEAPNALVLQRVRSVMGEEIRQLATQLEDIALVKLLNEVSNRKGRSAAGVVLPDLFGDYRGIPKQVTISRRIKKSTTELTIAQAEIWLETHTKKRNDTRYQAFRRMLEDLRAHQQSDQDTLAAMMERKQRTEQMELA